MINDPVLINDWHVVGRADDLPEGAVLPAPVVFVIVHSAANERLMNRGFPVLNVNVPSAGH